METKTGAIICRTYDSNKQFAYKPLAFITGIPDGFTDDDFKRSMDAGVLAEVAEGCDDVLYRADIHSTSNEVQEEFELLHPDSHHIPSFQFRAAGIPFLKNDPTRSIS